MLPTVDACPISSAQLIYITSLQPSTTCRANLNHKSTAKHLPTPFVARKGPKLTALAPSPPGMTHACIRPTTNISSAHHTTSTDRHHPPFLSGCESDAISLMIGDGRTPRYVPPDWVDRAGDERGGQLDEGADGIFRVGCVVFLRLFRGCFMEGVGFLSCDCFCESEAELEDEKDTRCALHVHVHDSCCVSVERRRCSRAWWSRLPWYPLPRIVVEELRLHGMGNVNLCEA